MELNHFQISRVTNLEVSVRCTKLVRQIDQDMLSVTFFLRLGLLRAKEKFLKAV